MGSDWSSSSHSASGWIRNVQQLVCKQWIYFTNTKIHCHYGCSVFWQTYLHLGIIFVKQWKRAHAHKKKQKNKDRGSTGAGYKDLVSSSNNHTKSCKIWKRWRMKHLLRINILWFRFQRHSSLLQSMLNSYLKICISKRMPSFLLLSIYWHYCVHPTSYLLTRILYISILFFHYHPHHSCQNPIGWFPWKLHHPLEKCVIKFGQLAKYWDFTFWYAPCNAKQMFYFWCSLSLLKMFWYSIKILQTEMLK